MCVSSIGDILKAPLKAHGKLFNKITPKPLRGLNIAGRLSDSLDSDAPRPAADTSGLQIGQAPQRPGNLMELFQPNRRT